MGASKPRRWTELVLVCLAATACGDPAPAPQEAWDFTLDFTTYYTYPTSGGVPKVDATAATLTGSIMAHEASRMTAVATCAPVCHYPLPDTLTYPSVIWPAGNTDDIMLSQNEAYTAGIWIYMKANQVFRSSGAGPTGTDSLKGDVWLSWETGPSRPYATGTFRLVKRK